MTTKEAKSISSRKRPTSPSSSSSSPTTLPIIKKTKTIVDTNPSNNDTNNDDDASSPQQHQQKDRKENRREQKELIKERKSQRPMATIISTLKPHFEIIRQKNVSVSLKMNNINEAMLICKSNFKDLSLRREGSRIVQSLVQYSTKEQRSSIVDELKTSLLDLSQSTYGMFVIKKILKEDPLSRDAFILSLKGSLPQFLKFKNSSSFLNDLYLLLPSPSKKTAFVAELYSREFSTPTTSFKFGTLKEFIKEQPAKRDVVLQSLKKLVTSRFISREGMIRLPLIQRLLNDYLGIENKAEILSVLPRLLPQIEILMDSVLGGAGNASSNVQQKEQQQQQQQIEQKYDDTVPQIISRLFSYSGAKERKAILKVLKKNLNELLKDWNLSLIIITIICQQDDTVLLGKVILEEMMTIISSSSSSSSSSMDDKKILSRILMLILSKDRTNNIMTPQTNQFLLEGIQPYSSSKKEALQRRDEIFALCSEEILSFLKANYGTLAEGNCMWGRNLLIEGHLAYGKELDLPYIGDINNISKNSLSILKEIVKRCEDVARRLYLKEFIAIINSPIEDISYLIIGMLRHPSLLEEIKGRRGDISPKNTALKKVLERLEE